MEVQEKAKLRYGERAVCVAHGFVFLRVGTTVSHIHSTRKGVMNFARAIGQGSNWVSSPPHSSITDSWGFPFKTANQLTIRSKHLLNAAFQYTDGDTQTFSEISLCNTWRFHPPFPPSKYFKTHNPGGRQGDSTLYMFSKAIKGKKNQNKTQIKNIYKLSDILNTVDPPYSQQLC